MSAHGPLIQSGWGVLSPVCPRRGKHASGEHPGDVKGTQALALNQIVNELENQ